MYHSIIYVKSFGILTVITFYNNYFKLKIKYITQIFLKT